MWKPVVLVILLLTGQCCSKRARRDITGLCINDVDRQTRVERFVENVRKNLREEEPFRLPSEIGPMRLTDGVLWGLSNFELRHEPQIACSDTTANITLLLGLQRPHVRYRWNFVPFPGVTGQFIAHAERATADIQLEAPLQTGPVSVKSLTVTELSQVWIKVPSVPVITWIASQIGNLGAMFTRNNLRRFLQDNLRTAVQQTLDKHPL
ncbi:uncharacterized protein LOC135392221 [Ornithodoros turicata]|uniref:uncharacterized protein LOC135392221 n=1 Tax=Ornithodoros turicata TaxID=34597 RepID=UPI003138B972